MSHAIICSFYHCVFATKGRQPLLNQELRKRLFPYLVGIAQNHKFGILAIGGIENHIHILMTLPATLTLSRAVQMLKGTSSKWIHDSYPDSLDLAWQEGYAAFSIGVSQKAKTIRYIRNQEEHHHKITFKAEYRDFLAKHGIYSEASTCG